LTKDGKPCHAAGRNDGDFCNAHSGIGVSADPSANGIKGAAANQARRERRAELKLLLGSTNVNTPKGAMRAAMLMEAERLVSKVLREALAPDGDGLKQSDLILRMMEMVEPKQEASLTVPLDSAQLAEMGLRDLMALADAYGITTGDGADETQQGATLELTPLDSSKPLEAEQT
jgi:hypothetical protein